MKKRLRKGFTLIELLVVIAIIAILIGLLLPAVQKVREAAARTQSQNNLKQFGLAIHNYNDAISHMPPAFVEYGAGKGYKDGSWLVHILPYVEQDNLKRLVDANTATSGQYYAITYNQSPPKVFINPTDPSQSNGAYNDSGWGIYSVTGYVANYEAMGGFVRRALVQAEHPADDPWHHRRHLEHDHVHHPPGGVRGRTPPRIARATSGSFYNIAPYANASDWYEWMPVHQLLEGRRQLNRATSPARPPNSR